MKLQNYKVETLLIIGLKPHQASVLHALIPGIPISARDLGFALGLRQPEVSIATKSLRSLGWIREGVKVGKSRREKTYELAMSWNDIVSDMEKQVNERIKQKIKQKKDNLNKLK